MSDGTGPGGDGGTGPGRLGFYIRFAAVCVLAMFLIAAGVVR